MAFNLKTFRTRAITAVLFAAVMLVGVLWNHWSFLVLFSIIHFGCWIEYFKLIEKIHQRSFDSFLKLGFMLTGYGLLLLFCGPVYHLGKYILRDNFSLPVSLAGFVFLIAGIFRQKGVTVRFFGAAALGIVYISLSWALMISMRSELTFPGMMAGNESANRFQFDGLLLLDSPIFHQRALLLCLVTILTMWINDTMAYIVGSFIGKTPLSKISPKKTWEGTIGGIILAALLVGWFADYENRYYLNLLPLSLASWIILAFIASVVGTLGDLLESKLKRMANVKDSGHIMPGHGGFLDRFDSLLLAVPFVWIALKLLIG